MRKSLLFILFTIMIVSTLPSQVNVPFDILSSNEPLPEWIKPGLVLVYNLEGGSRTTGDETGSAIYGKGNSVCVVTDVYKNIPFGLCMDLFYYPQFTVNLSGITPLFIYLSRNQLNEILKNAAEYMRSGIAVQGGNYGNGYVLNMTIGTTVYAFYFDHNGNLQKMSFLERTTQGSSVADKTFILYKYLNFPTLEDLPESLFSTYEYGFYLYEPTFTGMTTSIGRATIEYSGKQGNLFKFRISSNLQYMITPSVNEAYGTLAIGPHYINRSLLKLSNFLDIPEINFSWINEESYDGYIVSIYYQGQKVVEYQVNEDGLILQAKRVFASTIYVEKLENNNTW